MAELALASGKHVWCEKPMALTLEDAEAMAAAARAAPNCRTMLGYNYARNPALAHAKRLVEAGAIGRPFHFRGVVDEDYMADPDLPWSWRCVAAEAGLGTLGDIVVHLVSMAHLLLGPIARVNGEVETVHRDRAARDGTRRPVENDDMVQALVNFVSGASGVLLGSRVAWGRKNRLGFEIHGTAGTLCFDQERLNELLLFQAEGEPAIRGFRTILTGPAHPPYGAFVPAPGHQLGFNDLKVIEAAQFLLAMTQGVPLDFDFAQGLLIERVVHGIADAARSGRPVEVRTRP
jgi:predicted dehydrogenase